MTSQQCRAARGYLGWSQPKLAYHAKVSQSTIRNLEKNYRGKPPSTTQLDKIALAFSKAGVLMMYGGVIPAEKQYR